MGDVFFDALLFMDVLFSSAIHLITFAVKTAIDHKGMKSTPTSSLSLYRVGIPFSHQLSSKHDFKNFHSCKKNSSFCRASGWHVNKYDRFTYFEPKQFEIWKTFLLAFFVHEKDQRQRSLLEGDGMCAGIILTIIRIFMFLLLISSSFRNFKFSLKNSNVLSKF